MVASTGERNPQKGLGSVGWPNQNQNQDQSEKVAPHIGRLQIKPLVNVSSCWACSGEMSQSPPSRCESTNGDKGLKNKLFPFNQCACGRDLSELQASRGIRPTTN